MEVVKSQEETKYTEGSVKQTFKDAADKKSNETTKEDCPFIYIVHNLRGLINECEYYINVYNLYQKKGGIVKDSPLYNAY